MTAIQNNFAPNTNNPVAESASSVAQEPAVKQSGEVNKTHRHHLSASEAAQTDTLQSPSQGVRGNVLESAPPIIASAAGIKPQQLQSAQQKLTDLTQNFGHPTTGALILASEQGVALQSHLAYSATEQASPAQASLAAASTSSSTATADKFGNFISTDLDSYKNNPATIGADKLESMASEKPKPCGPSAKELHSLQASSVAKDAGLTKSQAKTLLSALNQNTDPNHSSIADDVNSSEQKIIGSALATLAEFNRRGDKKSSEAQSVRAGLADVSALLERAKSGKMDAASDQALGNDMNALVGGIQQSAAIWTEKFKIPSPENLGIANGPSQQALQKKA